ncbi:MAG TPA: hypothetical protein VFY64_01875 [Nitrososphaeraceae archaeon]|nr:hypothetical protein [Nitrososphaeraceae archaeon]
MPSLPSIPTTTNNNNKKLKKRTQVEVTKGDMNKPSIKKYKHITRYSFLIYNLLLMTQQ